VWYDTNVVEQKQELWFRCNWLSVQTSVSVLWNGNERWDSVKAGNFRDS